MAFLQELDEGACDGAQPDALSEASVPGGAAREDGAGPAPDAPEAPPESALEGSEFHDAHEVRWSCV